MSLKIADVANTATTGASVETVKTSADTTAGNAASVTIAGASAPTAVSFTGSPQTASARSTWAVGFTAGASGSLRAADTITVPFPNTFTVPAAPVIALTSGFTTCSATAVAAAQTVTITLADSGGTCAVANGATVALNVIGITNPGGGTVLATNFSVSTSADVNSANPAGSVTIGFGDDTHRRQLRRARLRPVAHARPGRSGSPRRRPAR